jgi:hypothetical protein
VPEAPLDDAAAGQKVLNDRAGQGVGGLDAVAVGTQLLDACCARGLLFHRLNPPHAAQRYNHQLVAKVGL